MASRLKAYLDKHQLSPLQVRQSPHPDLNLVIVIPCHDEPDLRGALDSLWGCTRSQKATEVIVVVNASESHCDDVHRRNTQTLSELRTWIRQHRDPKLTVHAIHHPRLPAKHAGVGLARKLGMDEAVARLLHTGNENGVIAGFDADCRCAPDYLLQVESHFRNHSSTPGCSIHFEHPLDGDADSAVADGIARYELYLRYYLMGLRYARFPHAYHTVGSSMAVRGWAYAKQGGMNRRQAGEDFYFLNKIIALGGFTELCATTVVPSARRSHRVPFGTGRAMTEWLAGVDKYQKVFSPGLFEELRIVFSSIPDWFDDTREPGSLLEVLPSGVADYLNQQDFVRKIQEIRANVARADTFESRFFRWFDAFRVFKFLRWGEAGRYEGEPLVEVVQTLLQRQQVMPATDSDDVVTLLHHLRGLDREGRFSPGSRQQNRM